MKIIAVLITSIMLQSTYSQVTGDKLYTYNNDWKPAEPKRAIYLLRIRQTSNNEYLRSSYNMYGPRISEERSMDEAGKNRNGLCIYYHPNGLPDSVGEFSKGLQNGSWYYYNNSGIPMKRRNYEKGAFIKYSSFAPPSSDSSAKPKPVPGEVESMFKGGARGWMRFLTDNFVYPGRAQKASIEGMVVLQYSVDENGNIANQEIFKSVEYSLDEEALRIIGKSPAWVPASKDGKHIKSYMRQPVIFKLTGK